jgi:hypothetical protein
MMPAAGLAPQTLSGWLLVLRFWLEIAGLILATRVYKRHRSRSFALLVAAFWCVVITQAGIFIFTAIQGSGFPQDSRFSRFFWIYFGDPISMIVFFLLLMFSLIAFLRERGPNSTPRI